MAENAVSEQELANREHIGPNKTGDNIAAKRSAGYSWDGTNWGRTPLPFIDQPYDDISFGSYDSYGNPATITYKRGGVVVRTLTLTVDLNGNITDITRT